MTKTANIIRRISFLLLGMLWCNTTIQAHAVFATPINVPTQVGPVILKSNNVNASEGGTACVDISVANFTDILHAQWTNTFDTNVLTFTGIQNFGLPGLTASNFTPTQGFIMFSWDAPNNTPVTLADDSVIFSICFDIIGDVGDMSTVAFTSLPLNIYVTDVNSNTAHIGHEFENGSVTIIPPPPPLEITAVSIQNTTCITPNSGAIDITVEGGTPPYTYIWSNNETTEDISGLEAMGYTVMVQDASMPSLETSVTYLVGADTTTPNVDAGEDKVIDCDNSTLILDGTGSDMGAAYNYTWTTNDGNIINGGNTLEPEVDQAGTYTLFVVNTLSGCTDMDEVVVTETTMTNLQADAGEDLTVSCVTDLVQLDGTNSDTAADIMIEWTTSDGRFVTGINTLTPVVDTVGTYVLTITDITTGCTASDEMQVTEPTYPMADAGDNIEVGCSEEIAQLDGTNSSQGTGFIYSWTTENGRIIDGQNTLTPTIDKLGMYELIVTNTATACAARDTINVILIGNLPLADVGEDRIVCENTVFLSANQPENTIGRWKTNSIAIIDAASSNETVATQIIPGTSVFIWTLSSAECLDYSSDTLYVFREGTPEAFGDQELLAEGGQVIEIDVVENDYLLGLNDWEVLLISEPSVGTAINLGDGNFSFSIPNGFMGGINFDYALCNLACAELCDTATVSIIVEEEIGGGGETERIEKQVNGITPNGDGVNDALIFDELLDNPTLYPRNELVVFNRWGDIVYKARPYNNDWEGTNQQGNLLPLGTYYYIFRLSVADGKITQGDVTLLK